MQKILSLFVLLSMASSFGQENKTKEQEKIIEEYLTNCAQKYNYTIQMAEWQNCLDEGLKKDSTIAYLWQQKAMPYFKARKYEIGMPFLDKAVQYNAERWQPYRGFMKCIFSKSYKDAIADLEDCKKKFGNGYVMDHSYDFYIAISYLQLDEFTKAETYLENYVDEMFQKRQGLEHPTALFYLGIAKYELEKYDEAIAIFKRTLKLYPNFSDAKFYMGICMARVGKSDEAETLLKEAKEDYKSGYTLNEDNTIYETYPYQRKWKE
ncbi:MAG: tetratricopeptide repeat protein [Flavobacterium sp. JAD_PAG50586_2]|nr:MAG: tetratricopeptide repeat protein [Flavobacterium sp. JAD_PAG50586_2]